MLSIFLKGPMRPECKTAHNYLCPIQRIYFLCNKCYLYTIYMLHIYLDCFYVQDITSVKLIDS